MPNQEDTGFDQVKLGSDKVQNKVDQEQSQKAESEIALGAQEQFEKVANDVESGAVELDAEMIGIQKSE